MTKFFVTKEKRLIWPGHDVACVIGRSGFCTKDKKREGDGATPKGQYFLRRVLYRQDRLVAPQTALPTRPLLPDDGWCDAPDDAGYNRPVRLPYPASTEEMFRQDHVYDLLVVLSHNDNPPVAGLGSAIFMHLVRPQKTPTQGCVALSEEDMRAVLAAASPGSTLVIID